MLKRSAVTGSLLVGLVGAGVVIGGGVVARRAMRRRAQKGWSGAGVVDGPLRAPEAILAGDAVPLVGDSGSARGELVLDFAEAMRRAPIPVAVGAPIPPSEVFEHGLEQALVMMAKGLDGLDGLDDVSLSASNASVSDVPYGEPSFKEPTFRQPDVVRRKKWRGGGAAIPSVDSIGWTGGEPEVEPWPIGEPVPVLEDNNGRPRRGNYRLKRARALIDNRLREDERWERFMGKKGSSSSAPSAPSAPTAPSVQPSAPSVQPSSLSVTEVDRFDELAQLGQIEMEIFQDGRPSGEHPSIGRVRRSWMWFRVTVLGEKS